MRKVTLPNGHGPWLVYEAKKPTRPKPTPPQQRILDQMRPNEWYDLELGKDRQQSSMALVNTGWLLMARRGIRDKCGQLREMTPEELFMEFDRGTKIDQPFEMYRIAPSQ